MSERDPLFSDSGPLSASRESDAGFRRLAPRPRSRDGRPVGGTIALVLLLVGLVVAGWFIFTQHRALTLAQDTLAKAGQRIAHLEERLQVTDQTMSDADKEVAQQLGTWQDEIRKLWDVTNKKHKVWIGENQASIKQHAETLKKLDKMLAEAKTDIARHESTLTQQAALAEQLDNLEGQLTRLVAQQRQSTDQLNAVRQTLSSLENGLDRRVTDTEKAVQAIDAYRLQLNSRLVDLQTRVDNLAAPRTP
jgi:chromosome segregation ATPase